MVEEIFYRRIGVQEFFVSEPRILLNSYPPVNRL